MSTATAYAPSRPSRRGARDPSLQARSWRLQALSVLAFSVLAMLASLRYAALLTHPSFPRIAGVLAIAAALACGLLAIRALSGPGRSTALGALALAAIALCLGLGCAGVPVRELLPWHWGLLARELGRGIDTLDGLWPYRGSSAQARTAVMACVPGAVIVAAALVFWPGEGAASRRRLAALALLGTLYVTGAANGPRSGWQVQGVLALLALSLWGWASRTRRAEDGRAAAWVLAGALGSIVAAGALAGGAVIHVASWQPFGAPGAETSFDWNQTYGPLPWSTSAAEMVQVTSRVPRLWRATELDRFDGTRFLASGHPPLEPPGLAEEPQNHRWIETTSVLVRGLRSSLLLSPGQILEAKADGPSLPTVEALAPDGTLAISSAAPQGTRYTTTAYVPRPTVAEMRGTPAGVQPSLQPYVEFDLPAPAGAVPVSSATRGGIAQIEASPYAGVYALARSLAAGVPDGYDVAARIEAFLRHGFIYDTDPPRSRYPIVSFLLENRRGYCQQFSAAMALLLRMDGIPARIGSGFLPGTRSAPGRPFAVSALDAHAWVEVFYSGIGWVTWDPTPEVQSAAGSGAQASPPILAATGRQKTERLRPARRPAGATRAAQRGPRAASGPSAPLFVGLAALLLVIAFGWRRSRHRRRAAADDRPGELVELTRALRLLRLEAPAGTTLAELERRLSRSYGAEVGGYLRSLRELRYAPPGTGRRPTARERRELRRALSSGRGPLARLRGLLALPPGREA